MAGLERLQHLLHRNPDVLGDLRRRRIPAELLGQRLGRIVDPHGQLLEATGQAHVPDVVAKVATQLAQDRRHRVGRERPAAGRVEPVDRLDQADACDLNEVVEGLGLAPVAHRQRAGERHQPFDQVLPDRGRP